MEKLHFPMVHFPFFLLQILSLLLLSSAQTIPTKYFTNCGSTSDVTVNGRNFVGDLNGAGFSIIGPSSSVSAVNSSTDTSLYQTARVFTFIMFVSISSRLSPGTLIWLTPYSMFLLLTFRCCQTMVSKRIHQL
jgi:hypothetical protein